ncbi:2OG-Fe(II) oxygenase [uncultured Sphingomonas sp.]|uniref:prolyl hydroxylase family protein n=1 Tax=uncultured Sphingomonas sp. TaxID=158754 RepID=UPI002619AA46|nr:2OG-Fe(II) oxygenase [uncultured Sphingomonas sp.]
MKTNPGLPAQPSPVRRFIGEQVQARLDANPRMERLPSDLAVVYRCRDYLDAKQCAALIALIDANRRPSTLLSGSGNSEYRTSESCDLDRWSPAIREIDEGVAALLGIAPENGETLQGQRYAIGQHFRPHHDYFNEGESYWPRMKATGGHRTWTAMIYLNDVAEGGATWFPQAGLRVAPKRGLLLAWNNMNADGAANDATLHEGSAVTEGVKYIVTKWFREGAWVKSG